MKRATDARARNGAAVVEAALCIPIAILLVVGTVELTRGMQLRQSITVSAYEGGRVLTLPGATSDTVRTSIQQVLADRQVNDYTIVLTPDDVAQAGRGELVTIRVTAPARDNALMPLRYFTGGASEISSSVTVMKEF